MADQNLLLATFFEQLESLDIGLQFLKLILLPYLKTALCRQTDKSQFFEIKKINVILDMDIGSLYIDWADQIYFPEMEMAHVLRLHQRIAQLASF